MQENFSEFPTILDACLCKLVVVLKIPEIEYRAIVQCKQQSTKWMISLHKCATDLLILNAFIQTLIRVL